MKRLFFAALVSVLSFAAHAASAPDTLAKVKAAKSMTIAYAPDSVPFSFKDPKTGKPVGYSVQLCEEVAEALRKQLGLVELDVKWVAGTTPERLKMVADGKADIECGVTTATLSRQEKVDFSIVTFVQSGGILARANAGITRPRDLGGKKIAVAGGTTTEKWLLEGLGKFAIMAEVVSFKDRTEAFAALEAGKVDAMAGDKIVLVGMVAKAGDPKRYVLMEENLSVEAYAFALPRGDPDFRLAVNRALAKIYRSPDLVTIFDRWFAPFKPTDLLQAFYFIGSME